jgi:hypothetical protein
MTFEMMDKPLSASERYGVRVLAALASPSLLVLVLGSLGELKSAQNTPSNQSACLGSSGSRQESAIVISPLWRKHNGGAKALRGLPSDHPFQREIRGRSCEDGSNTHTEHNGLGRS